MMTERIGVDTIGYEAMLPVEAMPTQPQISVIMACKNPGPAITACVESVLGQQGSNHELVVVDGASTDGTAEWLKEHRALFGACLSEPDNGVYSAMNKGTHLARGHWLLFLGADDRLAAPDVLARVQAGIGATDSGLFCGEAAYADGRVWQAPAQPSVRYRNFIHHQAAFYHRSLFAHYRYNETLRIQADYDLNLQLWGAGIRPRPLPLRVSICGAGGLSDSGRWANYREEITVRHRYFPARQCWAWDAGSAVRWLRKRLVRTLRPV